MKHETPSVVRFAALLYGGFFALWVVTGIMDHGFHWETMFSILGIVAFLVALYVLLNVEQA